MSCNQLWHCYTLTKLTGLATFECRSYSLTICLHYFWLAVQSTDSCFTFPLLILSLKVARGAARNPNRIKIGMWQLWVINNRSCRYVGLEKTHKCAQMYRTLPDSWYKQTSLWSKRYFQSELPVRILNTLNTCTQRQSMDTHTHLGNLEIFKCQVVRAVHSDVHWQYFKTKHIIFISKKRSL